MFDRRCYYAIRSYAVFATMPDVLLFILIFIAIVIAYTVAKVIQLNRRSEEQWHNVDKSKLREWDDDEDWGN